MIASWYQEILDSEEKTRERLKWLQDCLSCTEHTENTHGVAARWGLGWSRCKCGAFKWNSDRFWQDMPRDDREKMEAEVQELTELLANKSGAYEI